MLKDTFSLMRPYQWYKNLLVFLPIIFAEQLFNIDALLLTIIGFISLCLVSSANYVINDLIDFRKDQAHPEKKDRPISAGRIKRWKAYIIAVLLLACSISSAFLLSVQFILFVVSIFVLTQVYSFWLKNEAFADILLISVNFVLRAVSGAYVIVISNGPYVKVSPWLILCPFFLALFLVVGKRASDVKLLKGSAKSHRAVLETYSSGITKSLTIISTTLLIISYSLYIFLSEFRSLFFTLPFALYIIFRYLYLIDAGSRLARHPHLLIKDRRIMVSVLIFSIIAVFSIY